MLNIALPKGRLADKVYHLLEQAGFVCTEFFDNGSKLVIEDEENQLRYLLIKPSDVAIYVERGVADIGVVGKDILLETIPDVYELLDLQIGKCRMMVAAKQDYVEDISETLRVATKYVNITKEYYDSKNREIEVIHLNGSIELAPVLGLSNVCVDIVETGSTLKANNLKILTEILPISARLIANKSCYKFKNKKINQIARKLSEVIPHD